MRIMGGKDYYDGAVPFDVDNTRIFHRNRHEATEFQTIPVLNFGNHDIQVQTLNGRWVGESGRDYGFEGPDGFGHVFKYNYLIFAGVRYPYIRYRKMEIKYPHKVVRSETWWTSAPFLDCIKDIGWSLKKRPKWHLGRTEPFFTDNVVDIMTPKPIEGEALKYLVDNAIMIATRHANPNQNYRISEIGFKLNTDGLSDYGFPAVFDSWSAYGELEMFLGTILVNDANKMVQLSDSSLVAKHGFDERSFRNTHHRGKPRGEKEST